MLLLSRLVHRKVIGRDGCTIGRVADLVAGPDVGAGVPVVHSLVLSRRGKPAVLVPCDAVNVVHPQRIQLTDAAEDSPYAAAGPPGDGDVMLARDVLDTQVVDVAGQRLTRVADVVLARRHDGRLEVVGVEVGFDAVLRRLGLPGLANRIPSDAIAWTDLHLTSERGHAMHLATPRSAVHRLDARALAALVARLRTDPAAQILAAKDIELAADVIQASHPDDAERMLRALAESTAADVVAAMPSAHARHWRDRLSSAHLPRSRHLLRSGVWPRRRHRVR